MKCFPKIAMALCLLLSISTQAFAADYSIDGQDSPDYAKPTSVDYVYTADGGAQPNVDRSKDAALIPPAFGIGGIYTLNAVGVPIEAQRSGFDGERSRSGMSELSPLGGSERYGACGDDSASPGRAVIGGGAVVYPGSVSASTTIAATAFTDVTDVLYYANGSLGTLSIPSLGLNVKIVQGTDSAALAKGVGHFEETSIWNGNVCLAAHNRGTNSYFGQIHTLSIGDTVTLTTALGTRSYSVSSVAKVSETDREALSASSENRITLYTCVRDQRDLRWCVQAVEVR